MRGWSTNKSHYEKHNNKTVLINREGSRYATIFPYTQNEEIMPKKSLVSTNSILGGRNDVVANEGETKFICTLPKPFVFMLPAINERGEPIFKTDANGNNKVRRTDSFEFTAVVPIHSESKGKPSASQDDLFSFFIVSEEKLKQYYKPILEYLTKQAAQRGSRIFTDEQHWKNKNPVAFKVAQEKAELENTIAEKDKTINDKDAKIAELEKRLGFNKQGGSGSR